MIYMGGISDEEVQAAAHAHDGGDGEDVVAQVFGWVVDKYPDYPWDTAAIRQLQDDIIEICGQWDRSRVAPFSS